jgi:hypothetical protein
MDMQKLIAAVVAALEAGKSLKSLSDAECVAAFEGAKHLRAAIVAELTRRHGGKPVEAIRTIVMPLVGKLYAVPLVASESNRNKGELTLDRTAPKFEAAKTGLRDIVAAITQSGKGSGSAGRKGTSTKLEVPAEVLAAAAKLVALVNQYDLDDAGLKALAAQAVAQAFAK